MGILSDQDWLCPLALHITQRLVRGSSASPASPTAPGLSSATQEVICQSQWQLLTMLRLFISFAFNSLKWGRLPVSGGSESIGAWKEWKKTSMIGLIFLSVWPYTFYAVASAVSAWR